ncbi:metallophosphoesterase, partial [bacterium]|nr:metallophosphoesterase [bacterium]
KDTNEAGIADVCVSNGVEVVKTDAEGLYSLPVREEAIVFVIKPNGWQTPFDENHMPEFYYIHKPKGSPDTLNYPGIAATGALPASINFPLYTYKEQENFKAIIFGDPQLRNLTELGYLGRDVVSSLIEPDALFGVSLGDLAFDDLRVLEPYNEVVGMMGIPWYNVQGNHDMNFKAKDDFHATETYKRIYGPANYAYNYGNVHFIVLDDVTKEEGTRYHGEIGAEGLAFLKNDIKHVSEDTLVVVLFHIPLGGIRDKQAFLDILSKQNKVLALSAHTHTQFHEFYGRQQGWKGENELHHMVCATACGNWWGGQKDEIGIPDSTMGDGVPNGWNLITFAGNNYKIQFVPARRPADYQMNIFAPSIVDRAEIDQTKVEVNVFAGSTKSEVKMRFGKEGNWVEIKPMAKRRHWWEGPLPKKAKQGTHLITVRAKDMFGQLFEAHHIITIQ